MASRTDTIERSLSVEYHLIGDVHPDPRNARKHSGKQIRKLAKIINQFGWSSPIIIDDGNMVLAGHARRLAAIELGMKEVPCIRLAYLDAAHKKALAIADNAMTDSSGWDDTVLRSLLIELVDCDFDVGLTGLEVGAIDVIIGDPGNERSADPADVVEMQPSDQPTVTRLGDLWQLGKHRLLCGTSLEAISYERLLDDEKAAMIFTDPPYNVPVSGHVSGLGRHRHAEFAMASGEMSETEFFEFLQKLMRLLVAFGADGSIHYLCIDWRHVATMLNAAHDVYTEVKNICVWVKSNGGMGSLYRSRHELVVVFKHGTAPHVNNVELGAHGRWRTNVWEYTGTNAFSATRDRDLTDHPTVKPVELVADAIRDCSKLGDLILDPFIGSGTTILAAERTRRRAAGIEIEPRYVDTAIRRWETATGKAATLHGDSRTFAEIAAERLEHAPQDGPSTEEDA